jgi:myo-inositol-1(or 4)-monophosphatase
LFQSVNESTRGCLRTGSAALNICWAAAGKLQLAYGFGAKVWDVAGALAVAKAAGCTVLTLFQPNTLILDYCVGSDEAVAHLTKLASSHGLWRLQ